MKILYVDSRMGGHHQVYAKAFLQDARNDVFFVLPYLADEIEVNRQYIVSYQPSNFIEYLRWLNSIYKIAKKGEFEIVHFLYGDELVKYFGIGLQLFRNMHIIITFHQIRRSKMRDFSRRLIFYAIDVGVVHTSFLAQSLLGQGITNVFEITYPQLNKVTDISGSEAKAYWGIPEGRYVLAAIGTTSYYKGLDILLKALSKVEANYHLLIAGKEGEINEKVIDDLSNGFSERITKALRFLDDKEFDYAMMAADSIVLPYRKSFDGASGPLTEGVWRKKSILGSAIGSLKADIEENELGLTFEAENEADLASAVTKLVNGCCRWNTKSGAYRQKLEISHFLNAYYAVYLESIDKKK